MADRAIALLEVVSGLVGAAECECDLSISIAS